MFKAKRSQAALEFLMTYGWAILVVLIVISALAYFGVLNPQRMLPNRCSLPTGFSCTDYIIHRTAQQVTLNLVNGIGTNVVLTSINLVPAAGNTYTCTALTPNQAWSNGGTYSPVITCTGLNGASADQKYRWDIVMQYYSADSGAAYTKTVKGELYSTTET